LVFCKIEFLSPATGGASPDAVKEFDEDLKNFLSKAQRKLKSDAQSSGLYAVTHVEGKTIRAEALYMGPALSAEAIREWSEIAGPNSQIRITPERSVSTILRDVLRPCDGGPAARAELELACEGVRRVRALGALYAPKATPTEENDRRCPLCGSELLKTYRWEPIREMEAEGVGDLSRIRREAQRAGPPGGGAISVPVL
jgi:hypothetical protein